MQRHKTFLCQIKEVFAKPSHTEGIVRAGGSVAKSQGARGAERQQVTPYG